MYPFSILLFFKILASLFSPRRLVVILSAAGGADAVGHHRGTAGTAISGGDTFVTVGGFALTTLHTGSFPFRYGHFIILLILT